MALVLLASSLFVVGQGQEAIVLRFGEPVRVIHAPGQPGAGLNIKTPFIENVVIFDRRNQVLEADQEEIIDGNQQRLVVDAFLRYRISDPLQYYRTLRDEHTAQDRLERLVNSSLRQVLGSTTTEDIISARRDALMQQSKLDVARRAKESRLGIEVIDLRIKRADLPAENRASVYRRMQTQRQQIAAQYRAEGEQQKREIFAAADKEVAITLATAQQEGETTRGQGDAQRTRIFNQSYGRDPSFSAFYRSMQAYEAGSGPGRHHPGAFPGQRLLQVLRARPHRRRRRIQQALMPELIRPTMAQMPSFIAALHEGYSRDSLRAETPETIAAIADQPAWFLDQHLKPAVHSGPARRDPGRARAGDPPLVRGRR